MRAISDKMTSMVQDNNKKKLGNREALEIWLRFIVLVLVVLEKTFCSLTSQLLKIFFLAYQTTPIKALLWLFSSFQWPYLNIFGPLLQS